MPTIIKIKERQADKLYECAEKVHRGAKKLRNLLKMKFLSQKSLMSATAVAVMAVAQVVTAMKMMTTMRTTMSAEVYLALVDMVVVDTVEDAAINN